MSKGNLRKNRSFLSLDNLDFDEDEEEDQDDESGKSGASSFDDKDDLDEDEHSDGDEDILKKKPKGNMTARDGSPEEDIEQQKSKSGSKTFRGGNLEAQVERKLKATKINQDYINNWVFKKKKQEGILALDDALTPCKNMIIDRNRYEPVIFPTYVLQKAYTKISAVGSATALIAILNKNELSVANIGDSGFLVIRFKNGEPYCPHKSKEQQHAFNIPYQLS
mmetsp:Transcript_3218/g.4904  ORF Transcript_3218/g.4904 Transcript_3218/m.4904 type:complete len:222 (+) Transcript_3218:617-1282(+)